MASLPLHADGWYATEVGTIGIVTVHTSLKDRNSKNHDDMTIDGSCQ